MQKRKKYLPALSLAFLMANIPLSTVSAAEQQAAETAYGSVIFDDDDLVLTDSDILICDGLGPEDSPFSMAEIPTYGARKAAICIKVNSDAETVSISYDIQSPDWLFSGGDYELTVPEDKIIVFDFEIPEYAKKYIRAEIYWSDDITIQKAILYDINIPSTPANNADIDNSGTVDDYDIENVLSASTDDTGLNLNKGDVNLDSKIDIRDAFHIINYHDNISEYTDSFDYFDSAAGLPKSNGETINFNIKSIDIKNEGDHTDYSLKYTADHKFSCISGQLLFNGEPYSYVSMFPVTELISPNDLRYFFNYKNGRFSAYTPNNQNEGTLTFRVYNLKSGYYLIDTDSLVFIDDKGMEYADFDFSDFVPDVDVELNNASLFDQADTDHNGKITVSDLYDVFRTIFYNWNPEEEPVYSLSGCGDCNRDDKIDISDAFYVKDYIDKASHDVDLSDYFMSHLDMPDNNGETVKISYETPVEISESGNLACIRLNYSADSPIYGLSGQILLNNQKMCVTDGEMMKVLFTNKNLGKWDSMLEGYNSGFAAIDPEGSTEGQIIIYLSKNIADEYTFSFDHLTFVGENGVKFSGYKELTPNPIFTLNTETSQTTTTITTTATTTTLPETITTEATTTSATSLPEPTTIETTTSTTTLSETTTTEATTTSATSLPETTTTEATTTSATSLPETTTTETSTTVTSTKEITTTVIVSQVAEASAVINIEDIKNDEPVAIESEFFKAIFDKEAVNEILNQVESGTVELKYELVPDNIEELNVPAEQKETLKNIIETGGVVFEFTLTDENKETVAFSDEFGGSVQVTVPYNASLSDAVVKVYYIDANGIKYDMKASFDPATNTITFKTNHFSYYAIEEELPQTGNSDNYNAIIGIAALMTVTGIAIIIKNRKENEE